MNKLDMAIRALDEQTAWKPKRFKINYDFTYTQSGNKGFGTIEITVKSPNGVAEAKREYEELKRKLPIDAKKDGYIKDPVIRKADEQKFYDFVRSHS